MKLARWLWYIAFGVSLVILVGALPGYLAHVNQIDTAADFSVVQQLATALGAIFSVGCAGLCLVLAILLFARKSNEAMALFLSFYLLLYGIFLAGPLESFLPFGFPDIGNLALHLQGVVIPIPTLVLILIFPNGHFYPRWARWLVVAGILFVSFAFLTVQKLDEISRASSVSVQLMYAAFGILLIFAFRIQVYRYRKIYLPLERQQTKWVLYGVMLSYVLLILVSIPYFYVENLPPGTPAPWWRPLNGVGWWFALSIQPLAITLSILRYRLFAIDIIIRRTLIYSIITALLALFYFGAVIVLQQLFRVLTGAGDDLAIIISTLALAALFNPLRRRVQNTIDHRFYHRKYDAQQVLERFAATARDEVELDKLTGELLRVVDEMMQPTRVSLWLRPASKREDRLK